MPRGRPALRASPPMRTPNPMDEGKKIEITNPMEAMEEMMSAARMIEANNRSIGPKSACCSRGRGQPANSAALALLAAR